jgi:hypothetical protein
LKSSRAEVGSSMPERYRREPSFSSLHQNLA